MHLAARVNKCTLAQVSIVGGIDHRTRRKRNLGVYVSRDMDERPLVHTGHAPLAYGCVKFTCSPSLSLFFFFLLLLLKNSVTSPTWNLRDESSHALLLLSLFKRGTWPSHEVVRSTSVPSQLLTRRRLQPYFYFPFCFFFFGRTASKAGTSSST